MLELFNKKPMYDIVITGEEHDFEVCNCMTSMNLTSCNEVSILFLLFVFFWFFASRSGCFGEDRLAILCCRM